MSVLPMYLDFLLPMFPGHTRAAANYSIQRNTTCGGRATRHFIMLRPPASGSVR